MSSNPYVVVGLGTGWLIHTVRRAGKPSDRFVGAMGSHTLTVLEAAQESFTLAYMRIHGRGCTD